jgi:hypothetical protein
LAASFALLRFSGAHQRAFFSISLEACMLECLQADWGAAEAVCACPDVWALVMPGHRCLMPPGIVGCELMVVRAWR